MTVIHPLFPNVRRSPYFTQTLAAGANAFMPYNHMYMPISYGRDPRDEYTALTTGVTLWDVGAERQTALSGPDAVRLADHLATRDLSAIEVGQCKFTLICDPDGQIMTEPIAIRPFEDTVWISHGDVDLTLWARGIAMNGDYDATVDEPDVVARLRSLGMEAAGGTSGAFATRIESEMSRWRAVIVRGGITAD